MVNNINGVTSSTSGNARTGGSDSINSGLRADNQQTSISGSKPGVNDSFNISDEAKLLSAVQSRIVDLPDVDQERVEALRQQIDSGQYQVDSSSLAQSIINQER